MYGAYKQSLRELFKRFRSLQELYANRELALIDIEELEQCRPEREFDQRRAKIHLANKKLGMHEIDKTIADTEREFRTFYEHASTLKGQIGELTTERRESLDLEMWVHRLKSMAATDYMVSGRLGENTITMIQSLSPEVRKGICEEVAESKRQSLIDWFMNDTIPCQLPAAIESCDVKKIVQYGTL